MKIEVWEKSVKSQVRQGVIGVALVNVHELVCAPSLSITRELQSATKRSCGSVTVTTEPSSESHQTISMSWSLRPKKVIPTPLYLRILRKHSQTASFIPIYESEHLVMPPYHWKSIQLAHYLLSQGTDEQEMVIELYKGGRNAMALGSAITSLAELKRRNIQFQVDISDVELYLREFQVQDDPGFLDYIFGGCEIELMIGIDFTKSNGRSSDPESLHCISGDRANEYIEAIKSVGDILQYYDSDKRIPVYGFGAKLPPSFTHVSHCFALNGNIFDPEVQGIDEVVSMYKKACKEVVFHGPTVFSKMVHMTAECARMAMGNQDSQRYYLLLIITDGIINDMEATINEIVEASSLPLSIIIVGVGSEDFTMMRELDSDDKKLVNRTTQKAMVRDIVQFVPYRQMKGKQMELAKEVLYEVPMQLLSYMNRNGIKPGAPKMKQFGGDSRLSTYRAVTFNDSPSRVNHFELLKAAFITEMEGMGFDLETVTELANEGIFTSDPKYASEILETRPKTQRLKPTLRKEKRPDTQSKTVRIETEKRVCRVCFEEPIDVVLLECGHRVVCKKCVETLEGGACPSCRQPISRWVKTYDA